MNGGLLTGGVTAVAIGASAGGVEALSVLLPELPARLHPPVFVVLHLPPHRPSLLVDIMSPRMAVPVKEAEDKEPIAPGTVYFAAPDYHLLVSEGPSIALSSDEPVNFSRPSIDVLFESAADVYGSGLLAIVLTGASSDGADGLQAVARAGGRIVVQDPRDARVPTMTEAAIERARVDAILPLNDIAALLHALDHD